MVSADERRQLVARQKRDALGRWTEMGDTVHFMLNGKEVAGEVIGWPVDGPADAVLIRSGGKTYTISQKSIVGINKKATLPPEFGKNGKASGRGGRGGSSGKGGSKAKGKAGAAAKTAAKKEEAAGKASEAADSAQRRAAEAAESLQLVAKSAGLSLEKAKASAEKTIDKAEDAAEEAAAKAKTYQSALNTSHQAVKEAEALLSQLKEAITSADNETDRELAKKHYARAEALADEARNKMAVAQKNAEDATLRAREAASAANKVKKEQADELALKTQEAALRVAKAQRAADEAARRAHEAAENARKKQSEVNKLATTDIARVARDGSALIVKTDTGYTLASVADPAGERRTAATLAELVAGGRWRRATRADAQSLASVAVVAAGRVFVEEPAAAPAPRQYRVPPTVKSSIASALEAYSALLSEDDRQTAARLATHTQVDRTDIEWMHRFFDNIEKAQQLHGGTRGKNWAKKVLTGDEDTVVASADTSWTVFKYEAANPDVLFVAAGNDPLGEVFDSLYMIETDPDHEYPSPETVVYEWKSGEFVPTSYNGETLERECLIEIDHETAEAFARLLDGRPAPLEDGNEHEYYEAFSLKDLYPEERNLFDLAAAELDYESLDRFAAILADATGYSPAERSQNAARQPRGPGGKFGGGSPEPVGQQLTAYKKATLPVELPLVEDPEQLIREYIENAARSAGEQEEDAATASVLAAASARPAAFAEEEPAEATEVAEAPAAKTDPLYLAIVDDIDKTAVMDVVSIVPGEAGEATAWQRSGGEWVSAPNMLADIQGDTPPPLVQLEDPDLIKDVLRQVDESDGQEPVTDETEPETGAPEEAMAASAWELAGPSAETREKLAKTGEALPDGSYPIRNVSDLEKAIKAYGRAKDKAAAKRHIKKRARALNRYDLIPEEWKAAALFDDAHLTDVYGPFGEVIMSVTAAGVPGIADTPSDMAAVARLKKYWAFGEGAAKIRWGTPGDLTRAHRYLLKYLKNSGRAWGMAQNLHKMVFGFPNPESGRRG